MSAGMAEQPRVETTETPVAGAPVAETMLAATHAPEPPPPRHGLHWTGKSTLAVAPIAFLALAWGTGAYVHSKLNAKSDTKELLSSAPNGPGLYTLHCARCHGERGDGNGIAHLEPRARYFGYEKFKFASTPNAMPTDDDLLGILRRGIPGSAMPGFAYLSEAELRAVIDHVRRLTRAGIYEALHKKAMKEYDAGDGDLPNPSVLHQKAYLMSQPGAPLTSPGPVGPPTPDQIARGRGVYEKSCMSCHGPKGEGDSKEVIRDDFGRPIRPRNLTTGVYKGGGEVEHLYARIMLGIPGAGMPASGTTLPAKDIQDLLQYVRSLVPQSAKTETVVMTSGSAAKN